MFHRLASCAIAALVVTPVIAQETLRHLPEAKDYNPSPTVFETVLVAYQTDVQLLDGRKTTMMVYNGSTPGPTIEANLGDTLVVHFLNLLPETTVLHWHGIEMRAQMDGSHISQPTIPRLGYFRYEFKLTTAGTFWYHPHVKTNEQLEKGLHGAVIVRDPAEDKRLGILRSHEREIFLDDIKLNDNDNQLAPFSTDLSTKWIPWQRAEDQANSRPGNHILINGVVRSDDNIPTLYMRAGRPYRLRFISPSSGEVWRLNISDPRQTWYAIGSDQGLWNEAEPIAPIDKIINPLGHHNNLISNTDERLGVTLTSSDRAEVVIVPEGNEGDEFFIELHDFVKGHHVAYRDPQNNLLFGHDHFDGADDPRDGIRVEIIGQPDPRGWAPPSPLRANPIKPIQADLTKASLPIVFGHAFPNKVTGDVIFFAQVSKPVDLLKRLRSRQMTMPPMFGPKPMMMHTAADGIHVKVGSTHYFEVVNFTGGDHNFHLHGFHFQHIDTEFIDLDTPKFNFKRKALRLSNEDTIRVPKRPGLIMGRSFTIVRLAIRFDDSAKARSLQRQPWELLAGGLKPTATTSGGWLMHCHNLEHSAKGMMSFLTITR